MLADARAHATLPTSDLEATRPFYELVLGFTPAAVLPLTVWYRAGGDSLFVLAKSSGKSTGSFTQMGFVVSDIEAEIADLRDRGVVFEDYEWPKTEGGIATLPAGRAAWFKDPEGNLLGLIQLNDPI